MGCDVGLGRSLGVRLGLDVALSVGVAVSVGVGVGVTVGVGGCWRRSRGCDKQTGTFVIWPMVIWKLPVAVSKVGFDTE